VAWHGGFITRYNLAACGMTPGGAVSRDVATRQHVQASSMWHQAIGSKRIGICATRTAASMRRKRLRDIAHLRGEQNNNGCASHPVDARQLSLCAPLWRKLVARAYLHSGDINNKQQPHLLSFA